MRAGILLKYQAKVKKVTNSGVSGESNVSMNAGDQKTAALPNGKIRNVMMKACTMADCSLEGIHSGKTMA